MAEGRDSLRHDFDQATVSGITGDQLQTGHAGRSNEEVQLYAFDILALMVTISGR